MCARVIERAIECDRVIECVIADDDDAVVVLECVC